VQWSSRNPIRGGGGQDLPLHLAEMSAHSLCGKISPAVSDRLNDGEMLRDLLLPRGPIDHASLIDQCLDRMTLDVDQLPDDVGQ